MVIAPAFICASFVVIILIFVKAKPNLRGPILLLGCALQRMETSTISTNSLGGARHADNKVGCCTLSKYMEIKNVFFFIQDLMSRVPQQWDTSTGLTSSHMLYLLKLVSERI